MTQRKKTPSNKAEKTNAANQQFSEATAVPPQGRTTPILTRSRARAANDHNWNPTVEEVAQVILSFKPSNQEDAHEVVQSDKSEGSSPNSQTPRHADRGQVPDNGPKRITQELKNIIPVNATPALVTKITLRTQLINMAIRIGNAKKACEIVKELKGLEGNDPSEIKLKVIQQYLALGIVINRPGHLAPYINVFSLCLSKIVGENGAMDTEKQIYWEKDEFKKCFYGFLTEIEKGKLNSRKGLNLGGVSDTSVKGKETDYRYRGMVLAICGNQCMLSSDGWSKFWRANDIQKGADRVSMWLFRTKKDELSLFLRVQQQQAIPDLNEPAPEMELPNLDEEAPKMEQDCIK